MWGAYFCMGAYKRDGVVVIKMNAYIHGCLLCVGAYYPDFTVDHTKSYTSIAVNYFYNCLLAASHKLCSIIVCYM